MGNASPQPNTLVGTLPHYDRPMPGSKGNIMVITKGWIPDRVLTTAMMETTYVNFICLGDETMRNQYTSQLYPEFVFKESNSIITAQRVAYFGDKSYCCKNDLTWYYNGSAYVTCDTRPCDDFLVSYCFEVASSVNPTSKEVAVCSKWISEFVMNRGYNYQFDIIADSMYNICNPYTMNRFCKAFMNKSRLNPVPDAHDQYLTKRYKYGCSFYPTKKAVTNRVCIDPKCITSEPWELLYKDYVDKANCQVSNSLITFQTDNNSAQYINTSQTILTNPPNKRTFPSISFTGITFLAFAAGIALVL